MQCCPNMKLLTHMPVVWIRSPWLCFVFILQIRKINYPCGKWGGSQYKDFSPSRLVLLYLPALRGDNKNERRGNVIKCKVHAVPQPEDAMCMSQRTASKQKSVLSWQYWDPSKRQALSNWSASKCTGIDHSCPTDITVHFLRGKQEEDSAHGELRGSMTFPKLE